MKLSLDTVALGVPRLDTARTFYSSALFNTVAAHPDEVELDIHGTGRLALHRLDTLAAEVRAEPATKGFRGHVLSVIVDQPSEVTALLKAATKGGASVLKPAKKGFFGGFAASYRAPDGAVWKLAAGVRKDRRPASGAPQPTQTAIYLGVTTPRATKAFYEELGMSADHDYGNKFIDFTPARGGCRLGLLPRTSLANDVGVDEDGRGFSAMVLIHRASSTEEVDHLLATADAVGGRITVPAATVAGTYSGCFTDPDGYHWKVSVSG